MDCAMCGGKGLFQVEDLPVGPRWFCTEKHFAEYTGLPVKESGYYGFDAETFESPLARGRGRVGYQHDFSLNKDHSKAVRQALKKEYPQMKIRVKIDDKNTMFAWLVSGNQELNDDNFEPVKEAIEQTMMDALETFDDTEDENIHVFCYLGDWTKNQDYIQNAETFESRSRFNNPGYRSAKRRGNENHLVWATDSKAVREALKTSFPDQKFSVRIVNGQYIDVSIKSGKRPADIEQFKESVEEVAMNVLGEIYKNSPYELREKHIYVPIYEQDFDAESFEDRLSNASCPACGHKGLSIHQDTTWNRIKCDNCGIEPFGAEESKKLPPVEKAIDTGIASGATMEGLETLLAAESAEEDEDDGYWDDDEAPWRESANKIVSGKDLFNLTPLEDKVLTKFKGLLYNWGSEPGYSDVFEPELRKKCNITKAKMSEVLSSLVDKELLALHDHEFSVEDKRSRWGGYKLVTKVLVYPLANMYVYFNEYEGLEGHWNETPSIFDAEYNRDSKGRFSAKPVITLTTAAIVGFVGAYLWGRRN